MKAQQLCNFPCIWTLRDRLPSVTQHSPKRYLRCRRSFPKERRRKSRNQVAALKVRLAGWTNLVGDSACDGLGVGETIQLHPPSCHLHGSTRRSRTQRPFLDQGRTPSRCRPNLLVEAGLRPSDRSLWLVLPISYPLLCSSEAVVLFPAIYTFIYFGYITP